MALTRVAVVTGAARGIGRAIALRLANDGFDVALNDIDSKSSHHELVSLVDQVKNKGRRVVLVPGDVRKEGDVKAFIGRTVQELGGLDVMVANAGIAPTPAKVLDTTTEQWDQVFAVNVRGVFLCYKYAIEQMIKQGRGGRVIGASSMYGKQGAVGTGAYCASKFAVRGLTQSAAKEYGKHDITVNAYAPGFIRTPLLDVMGDGLDAFLEKQRQDTALGRLGTPEDIASVVSFLASQDSSFITGTLPHPLFPLFTRTNSPLQGQTISVNGGNLVFD
ncbi:hypothetical protein AX17_007174 [Amanita inopinata Kibby_2008]|nr:hypothetical protein AX17_007174 [Amanita inopinata Kibby_2008]